MKKLTLDVESLEVQSFDTAAREPREGGTVKGHVDVAKTLPTNECQYSICPTYQFQCSVPECYPPA